MPGEVSELAILLGLAAAFGIVARLLRQPLVVAYLAAGVAIGLFHGVPIATDPLYKVFSELGIMLLLFLIGLEINVASLRLVGAAAVVIGVGQIVLTGVVGLLLAWLLGFAFVPALYIAITMTFSSTIIIVKLLSEKRELNSLYGKISIGFLLVQDVIAVLLLLGLASVEQGQAVSVATFGMTFAKGAVLAIVTYAISRSVVPWVLDRIAKSSELLFITSLAWLFIVVSVVQRLGFSLEIGGFLAGLSLANSSEHFLIGNRVKPLRDFFLPLFFITLGTGLAGANFSGLVWPIVAFSGFVLIGNPLIVMLIMSLMGYHQRTSFLAGVTVAQVSEFSLVVAALGLKIGHIQGPVVTLITAVAVITIIVSSYMILNSEQLYIRLHRWLRWLDRHPTKSDESGATSYSRKYVIIGADRTGSHLLRSLPVAETVIIDFNPDIIYRLSQQGYLAIYGDIADPDIVESIDFAKAAVVVCTSPTVDDTLTLLAMLRDVPVKKRPLLISRAETSNDAETLYQAGADYVAMPHHAVGHHMANLITSRDRRRQLQQAKRRDSHALHQPA